MKIIFPWSAPGSWLGRKLLKINVVIVVDYKVPFVVLLACSIAEHDMAKFQPMELMSEVHGKLHGKSKYYAAEKYGTQYTGLIGEISVPPTENQLTAREKFKQARQNVCALSEEEIAAYQEAFRKYRGKYKSLQGYMLAKEYAKLV